jgi:glycerol-3-phosphate acyltransferase PlsX
METVLKIVVDAMGGDHAPQAVVAGVIESIQCHDDEIVLVGVQDQVEAELKKYSYDKSRIKIVHTSEVVAMDEPGTITLRKKKNSSISLGIKLLRSDGCHAFVSAGNTGAVVAAASINLGMLNGVDRPAIGCVVPTLNNFAFIIDAGANPDPKPQHLLQSSLLAIVYVKEILGIENPSVGLLNIGEEATKGTDFIKETHKMMANRLPNFIGNIEANEIYSGKCHCIICDGFSGNITIKVSQSLVESAIKLLKREIKKSPLAMLGALLMKHSLANIRHKGDYAEYGGAPLLGVNGNIMICHGRSNPKAIKNAIRAAQREVQHNIISRMENEIGQ